MAANVTMRGLKVQAAAMSFFLMTLAKMLAIARRFEPRAESLFATIDAVCVCLDPDCARDCFIPRISLALDRALQRYTVVKHSVSKPVLA